MGRRGERGWAGVRRPGTGVTLLVILATALFFLWPAFLNRYPLLFSDTGGFLEQALMPDIGWDKPWIYGPLLTPFHARLSLWPAAAMQAVLLSAALWLTQAAVGTPSLVRHVGLCAVLGGATAAPWFASLLMPDILAPITALGLFVLAQARAGRATLAAVAVVTTIAIAAHLAHLILAAGCIATLALVDWRTLRRTLAPLAAALALLLLTNWVGNGRLAISPYGANFALARLVADGPARTTIAESCPGTGWRLCAWRDRLPGNSDDFLWDPNGPVWADGYGPTRIAAEAGTIVRATILAHPAAVLAAALANTARQLVLTAVGDTLGPDYLGVAVLPRVQAYFPPAEAAHLTTSRQYGGALRALAAPFAGLQAAVLVAATIATMAIAGFGWRRNRHVAVLAAVTLAALLANAFSTGALSGPHDRYQARLAWLVVVPPLLFSRSQGTRAEQSPVRPPLAPAPPRRAGDESSAG